MDKKKIKINFADFWTGFNINENMFMNILKKKFDVDLSEKPDYLIYSDYGFTHLDHDCIRFYYTGEAITPDFNVCDYAIGNDWIKIDDRYLRWPTYRRYNTLVVYKKKRDPAEILSEKTGFCNFIYTDNKSDPIRGDFFKRLSEYQFVDSMGSYLKNKEVPELSSRFSGDWIQTKINILQKYKFTIAFENSRMSGYTTEKLVHAMQADTIPIYWGNPHVDREFNPDSFVWVRDHSEIESCIEEIIRLNENDNLWKEKMSKAWVTSNYIKDELTQDSLENFIFSIFDQDIKDAQRRFTSVWKEKRNKLLLEGRNKLKK